MNERGRKVQTAALEVLRRRGVPLSAYDVLAELRGANPRMAPPTIYRALAALMERGDVHRLESMNAYLACQCANHQQASILSICDDCGMVEENVAPELLSAISKVAGRSGFEAKRHVIELHGVCSSCGTGEARQ